LGVYLILVTVLLNRAQPAAGLSLACAVVPFQLLMMTVINGLNAVEIRRSIIAKMSFPTMLIPVASAMTESVAFGASLLLLAGMMAGWSWPPATTTSPSAASAAGQSCSPAARVIADGSFDEVTDGYLAGLHAPAVTHLRS
jgi:ABC-type polysaccharide/polyol phosphate export permease